MKKLYKLGLGFVVIIVFCSCIGSSFTLPVDKMTVNDYNQRSFWYGPWGQSVVHKGVDIFGDIGTNIFSSTYGIVVIKGYNRIGGNAVMVLSPDLTVHYYAHLDEIHTSLFSIVTPGEKIGTLGETGNAKGKGAHLHYGIHTLIPNLSKLDLNKKHGIRKMFYIDPIPFLNDELNFVRKK